MVEDGILALRTRLPFGLILGTHYLKLFTLLRENLTVAQSMLPGLGWHLQLQKEVGPKNLCGLRSFKHSHPEECSMLSSVATQIPQARSTQQQSQVQQLKLDSM